jgi:hypothetical protein
MLNVYNNISIYEAKENIIILNQIHEKAIVIERRNLKIFEIGGSLISNNNQSLKYTCNCLGILGIIHIGLFDFLIYIKEAEKIGNIGNTEIFEILEIELIMIEENNLEIGYTQTNQTLHIMKSIKDIFQQKGFYCSNNFDLTNSLQRQKQIKLNNNYKLDIFKDANYEYMWNNKLLNYFLSSDITDLSIFLFSCIYGYICIKEQTINDINFRYCLISRKSTYRPGIISHQQGIDSRGHCANFIETEQILINNHNIFSFLQLRGSPPVHFNKISEPEVQSILKSPNKKLERSQTHSPQKTYKDSSFNSFDKHIQYLLRHYGLIFLVNLLSKEIQEAKMTKEIEQLIQDHMDMYQNVKYSFFDLDENMQNSSITSSFSTQHSSFLSDPLESYLQKLESILKIFKFFAIYYENNKEENKVSLEQTGVIRTFCYDALEKCNKIQERLAWTVLLTQFEILGLNTNFIFGNKYLEEADLLPRLRTQSSKITKPKHSETLESSRPYSFTHKYSENRIKTEDLKYESYNNAFIHMFHKIWTENDEKLSNIYLGTDELHLSPKKSFSGDIDEFQYNSRQRSIDILLNSFKLTEDKSILLNNIKIKLIVNSFKMNWNSYLIHFLLLKTYQFLLGHGMWVLYNLMIV